MLTVACYNVENLSPYRDADFAPQGVMCWTPEAEKQKIENLARVIKTINGGLGPDILALNEVGSVHALESLARALDGCDYECTMVPGDDPRGVENAILHREPIVDPPKLHRMHRPSEPAVWDKATRGLLEVTFEINRYPLTLVVCHWPSQRGGAIRDLQRKVLADAVAILAQGRAAIFLGDFNINPHDGILSRWELGTTGDMAQVLAAQAFAFNVLCEYAGVSNEDFASALKERGPEIGTLYFADQNTWHAFDQMFLTRSLLEGSLRYVQNSCDVLREPFMLSASGKPKPFYKPGLEPRRHRADQLGYSDHLPVVIRLHRPPLLS